MKKIVNVNEYYAFQIIEGSDKDRYIEDLRRIEFGMFSFMPTDNLHDALMLLAPNENYEAGWGAWNEIDKTLEDIRKIGGWKVKVIRLRIKNEISTL